MVFLMIKDLFEQMEKYIINHKNKLNILLRFGHAENMYPLITALGLFKDNLPLQSDNYKEHLTRNFKSGLLTPFSANVAFVLHKCENSQESDASIFNSFKVSILVNELPVSMINNAGELRCSTEKNDIHRMCNFLDFKYQLNKYLNLDYDKVCINNNKEKGEL